MQSGILNLLLFSCIFYEERKKQVSFNVSFPKEKMFSTHKNCLDSYSKANFEFDNSCDTRKNKFCLFKISLKKKLKQFMLVTCILVELKYILKIYAVYFQKNFANFVPDIKFCVTDNLVSCVNLIIRVTIS